MSRERVRLTADKIAEKWGRRLKAAIPDVVSGVQAVTDSPAEAAIAKQDKMRQNLVASIDDGTWAKQLSKVSLADWKSKTVEKVQQRLSGGVDAGMSKRKEFDNWMVDTLNGILPTINAMPDMTIEDSIQRAATLMRHMSENRYKKR